MAGRLVTQRRGNKELLFDFAIFSRENRSLEPVANSVFYKTPIILLWLVYRVHSSSFVWTKLTLSTARQKSRNSVGDVRISIYQKSSINTCFLIYVLHCYMQPRTYSLLSSTKCSNPGMYNENASSHHFPIKVRGLISHLA